MIIASVTRKIELKLVIANAVIMTTLIPRVRNMVMPIIKCQECNLTMRTQVNDQEYILYCDPCRRAVIVSDWDGNTEFFGQQPSDD